MASAQKRIQGLSSYEAQGFSKDISIWMLSVPVKSKADGQGKNKAYPSARMGFPKEVSSPLSLEWPHIGYWWIL